MPDVIEVLTGTAEARFFPRWLRVAAGTVLLATATENWLGAREWSRYVDEAVASGERVDKAAVIPPEVPEDENFATIPFFRPLFDYERATSSPGISVGDPVWRDRAATDRLTKLGQLGKTEPKSGWGKGLTVDLAEWQKRLRTEGLVATKSDATPGADLLRALAEHEPDLNVLRAAAARPDSRFPVRYDELFPVLYPHLGVISKYTFIARARTLASLSLSHTDAAAADMILALRLANSIHREPQIVSHTLQIALVNYAMQPLWEGLALRRWNDLHLAALDDALARFDFLESYACAMRGERSLGSIPAVEALKKDRDLFSGLVHQTNKPFPMLIIRGICRILPSGTYDFNKAYLARYHNRVLKTLRVTDHRVFVEEVEKLEEDFRRDILSDSFNPRKTLVRLLSIAITSPLKATARTQTMIDLARVAVALERHRIRHGSLPLDLASLMPGNVKKLPNDVITGDPLRYRPNPDGTFILYGAGWNGRDDGGKDHGSGGEDSADSKTDDWSWPKLKAGQ